MATACALVDAGKHGGTGTRLRRVMVAGFPFGVPLVLGVFALLLYN